MYSKLLKKEIIYQTHATHRSFERKIAPQMINEIIDDEKTQVSIQKNRRIKFSNNGFIVIGELRDNSLWIITTYTE